MAGRSKKKIPVPPVEQAIEDTTTDDRDMGMAQAVSVDGDSEVAAIGDDGLAATLSHFEQTATGSSEVDMSANTEITEAEASGEGTADGAVEPVINLEANLSIQNVVKLYEKLKKAYAAYDAIEIDASHVASVDTATLQVFVALKKDAAKQQKKVDFFQPSQRFVESARLLDLLDILEITYI